MGLHRIVCSSAAGNRAGLGLLLERAMRRATKGTASSAQKYATRGKGAVVPGHPLLAPLPRLRSHADPRGQSQRPRRVASRSWCAKSAAPTAASARRSTHRRRALQRRQLLGRE